MYVTYDSLFLILGQSHSLNRILFQIQYYICHNFTYFIDDMSEFTESDTFQILEEYFLNILYSLECMATDMTHYLKA